MNRNTEYSMWRTKMIEGIKGADQPYDVAVIGGGATGLGIAVDAASRGYSTVLLERDDFAKGTSSRSTKLAHGGVRYLAQGNIRLVLEALRERGIMRRNAPALVRDLSFIVPAYRWWEIPFYYIGLKLYDLLSGKRSLGKSLFMSASKVKYHIPCIRQKGLKGGILYHDGQFDDSRLAISLAKTAELNGATVLNYAEITEIVKDEEGDLFQLIFKDRKAGQDISLSARAVFNATGVFVDQILTLEQEQTRPLIAPSRGAHVVVDRRFLDSQYGLMIPKTPDGRVLFTIPWYDKTLIGTTDAPVDKTCREPQPSKEEIQFILKTASAFMTPAPEENDILSVFAGLRPLAAAADETQNTKEISRGHKVLISPHGMITIIGGKWTTYRRMAEDAIDKAIKSGRLQPRKCRTVDLPMWISDLDKKYGLGMKSGTGKAYNETEVDMLPGINRTEDDIRYMIKEEYAMSIEDVLSRRVRLLILDADTALKVAPVVGGILEEVLGPNDYDKTRDIRLFSDLAKNYRWSNGVL